LCVVLQIGLINHTADAIAAKIQKLLSKPEYAAKAASAGEKMRSVCGPAVTAWLLADFARPPPVVESDSAASADDTAAEVVGGSSSSRKKQQKAKKKGAAAEKGGGSWWPRFDRRSRSTGDLARGAVAAH
jgi:hypothetical protein